ncbi:hypothetical protein ACFSTC_03450 [Nonomuraea ferruginea]
MRRSSVKRRLRRSSARLRRLHAAGRPGGRPAAASIWLSALSITGAMLLLVYGVVRLEHPGDGLAGTIGVRCAAGAACRPVWPCW